MKKRSNISVLSFTIGIVLLLVFLFFIGIGNLWKSTAPPSTVSAMSLVGTQAPVFALTDAQGETFTNEAFRGKNVVLFFNEGLRCYPSCWNAMIALADDERFRGDTLAYSVVVDDPDEWRQAAVKVPELRNIKVLFDKNGDVSRSFGMLTLPSSMHRGSLPGHTYLILDGSGYVRSINDDPRMGVRNDDVAAALQTITQPFRL